MRKALWVAWREFVATVATKGFIIGVLVTPLMIGVVIVGFSTLLDQKPPRVEGELALLDPTGRVAEGVRTYLAPDAIAERWDETVEQALQEAPEPIRQLAETSAQGGAAQQALDAALGEVPLIVVSTLSPGFNDLESEKRRLREGSVKEGDLLALAVIHEDAVDSAGATGGYGKYDLFVREGLDNRVKNEIKGALRHSIVGARIQARGLDRKEIEALTWIGRVRATTVTEQGERTTNEELDWILPMGFMGLLLISVMTSGQYLLTSTVEEKSSRVVEVLLSAVSPMQLMTGKIVGQMCVGFVIMVIYAGMGIASLLVFALMGAVKLHLFFYLLIFYLLAYFIIGSFMAAIGAAVNEMREAQTLMTPVMLIVIIPWLLWLPISQDPNSTFAVVTSFVPPINTFVMLLRMATNTPPPWWQVWLSIGIGVASVYGALWFAAKVFRVGLLMYGKPPNFATLIRWVRMA